MIIRTIKDLKTAIENLPDDLAVEGYNGGDIPRLISYWIHDPNPESWYEKKAFIISTD